MVVSSLLLDIGDYLPSLSPLHGVRRAWGDRLWEVQSIKAEKMRRLAVTTNFTGEPSHLRMCRELIPRFDHALAVDNAKRRAEALGLTGLNLANVPELQMPEPIEMEYLIVEEDEAVCSDEASPHLALLQMASSALLSAAARKFDLNVEYLHNCPRWRQEKGSSPDDDPVRVQEMIPIDMLSVPSAANIPLEVLAVKNICAGCITETDLTGISKRNCVLFTRPTVYNPSSITGKKKRRKFKTMAQKRAHMEEDRRKEREAQMAKAVQLGLSQETLGGANVDAMDKEEAPAIEVEAAEAQIKEKCESKAYLQYTVLAIYGKLPIFLRVMSHFLTPAHSSNLAAAPISAEGNSVEGGDITEEEGIPENEEESPAEDFVIETAQARRLQELVWEDSRRLEEMASPASPKALNQQLPTGIVSILPTLVDNLRHIAKVWNDSRMEHIGEVIQDRVKTRPGAMTGPSLKSPEELEIMRRRKGEKTSYSLETNDEAIIYLSCKKEMCEDVENSDALAMPFYIYSTEIPRHVASIQVVAASDCVKNAEGCREHGQALAGFLDQYYPRTLVEYIEETSTFAAYARMINANYLVCPPGTGCVLPAIAQLGHSSLVGNPNLVPWMNLIPTELVWNSTFLHYQEVPVSPLEDMDFAVFLNKIPPGKIGQCRSLRGRLGSWDQDLDHASEFQYKTPIRHYVGEADLRFEPTPELPFRPSTTYRWKERTFPTCDLQIMTLDGLCTAMADTDMERIFILGDSLAMNMAQSLWKLLGHEDNPSEFGTRDPNWDREVDCGPDFDGFTFTISYGRNDQLLENDRPVDIGRGLRNCFAYCYPWTERYASFPGNTVLVLNTGAHYQSHHEFQYTTRQVLKTIDEIGRKKDVVLWRSSTPGHRECDSPGLNPLESYDEYSPAVTDEFSWDKFVGYNDYVSKVLDLRAREDKRGYDIQPKPKPKIGPDGIPQPPPPPPPPTRTRIELLDVYPMTVLRPDGHVSGEECGGETNSCAAGGVKDCLHFFLPGPLDWWSHAMYSHLLDMARRG